jgi:hypothetical protein
MLILPISLQLTATETRLQIHSILSSETIQVPGTDYNT